MTTKNYTRTRSVCPLLENLEPRSHCDAGLSYAHHVLTITGTSKGDDIELGAGKSNFFVEFNHVTTSFSNDKVKLIRIFGGAGQDGIIVSPHLNIPCSIEGGPGGDEIGGGAANDTIFGQGGNDTITGNGGNDYLDGGADNDRFDDRLGMNVFHGGAGVDRVISNNAQLTSGIEYGTIPTYSIGVTDLKTVNGHLILTYQGSLPAVSASMEQTGPTLLADGEYEITSTYHDGFDAAVGSFINQWDVTTAAPHGVIFTVHDSGAGGEPMLFSLPLLLPTR